MALVVTSPPAGEPVSLSEVKAHCRVDGADDDGLLTALIIAARELAEQITERAFITQSWKLVLPGFCYEEGDIDIPKPPLVSVESVKYIDTAGVQQTWASSNYLVNAVDVPGEVVLAYQKTWPLTRDQFNAVEISFTCGYGNSAAVPQSVKQWMLININGWYENRSSFIKGAIMAQLPRTTCDGLLDSISAGRIV